MFEELTVTITLGEYRELVSSKATAKQEIDAKVMKVAALEQELYAKLGLPLPGLV